METDFEVLGQGLRESARAPSVAGTAMSLRGWRHGVNSTAACLAPEACTNPWTRPEAIGIFDHEISSQARTHRSVTASLEGDSHSSFACSAYWWIGSATPQRGHRIEMSDKVARSVPLIDADFRSKTTLTGD
jgi:hypothetical protein